MDAGITYKLYTRRHTQHMKIENQRLIEAEIQRKNEREEREREKKRDRMSEEEEKPRQKRS